jgi:hypothetical protein
LGRDRIGGETMLKHRAHDENERIRQMAIQELERRWNA